MHTFNFQTQLDFYENQPYLNIDVSKKMVKPYLLFLQKILPFETYTNYVGQQQKRDHNQRHITIINPKEYPQIDPQKIMPTYPVTVNLLGVGHIQEDDNEVYFIVCES